MADPDRNLLPSYMRPATTAPPPGQDPMIPTIAGVLPEGSFQPPAPPPSTSPTMPPPGNLPILQGQLPPQGPLSAGVQAPPPSQMPTLARQDQPTLPGVPSYTGPADRGGFVKNVLTRMLYGMGQAGLQHVGLPTDFDIQRKQYSDALKGAQVQVEQAHQRLLEQQQQYQQGLVTYQDPRTGFTYQVPPSVLPKLVPATVTGGYSLDKQTLANQGRFGVEQMKAMINAGIVRKYLDSVDENGNPGVQMLNQNGVPMGFVPGAVAKSFVPTYSTTQQHVQDKNGVWQVFDVTTAKTPGIPPGTGRVPSGSTPAIPSPTTPSISPTAPSGIPPAVKTRISPTSPAGKAM